MSISPTKNISLQPSLVRKMSFPVEALQSRSRQEANSKMQRDREPNAKRDEPIIATMGEVAKGIADAVSNLVCKIWPKTVGQRTIKPNPALNDVTVDVDAMIVYDQPIEDDFVEVAFVSQVQTTPRKRQPSLAEDIGAKPPTRLSITIPESPKKLDKGERKERHFI